MSRRVQTFDWYCIYIGPFILLSDWVMIITLFPDLTTLWLKPSSHPVGDAVTMVMHDRRGLSTTFIAIRGGRDTVPPTPEILLSHRPPSSVETGNEMMNSLNCSPPRPWRWEGSHDLNTSETVQVMSGHDSLTLKSFIERLVGIILDKANSHTPYYIQHCRM